MKKFSPLSKDFPHLLLGGDYNPEQWLDSPEILAADMELMKEADCNEMSMGIFSWDSLEPEEGVFQFDWLDERMDSIYKNGGRVILATPSAARPRWLAEKYPEVMYAPRPDRRHLFAKRQNQCLRSPVYQEKVRIIDEMLAKRYANHPALIAWHLSNEYYGRDCRCQTCRLQFREWLRRRYDNDLKKLNHAWWTPNWSRQVQSFDQIEPPENGYGEVMIPGMNLDWKRFCSDTVYDFVKLERDAVKKYSDKPVTTNCMNFFERYDHRKVATLLDFYSNDTYPTWWEGLSDDVVARYACFSALCRGMMDGKPFIQMESAPGINMAHNNFRMLKSTQLQIFEAMLFLAHGSDSVLYFQWRKGRGGCEKYHGAVVDHYGKTDNRVFQAVKTIGGMMKNMDGVVGTTICADVAIVSDYETRWAINGELEYNKDRNGYQAMTEGSFAALFKQNVAADVIGYGADFSKYKFLILPPPYMMTPALAKKIKTYVQNGGRVVSFYMAGMVDENDLTHLGGAPGCGLRELFGLRIDEMTCYDISIGKCGYENAVTYGGITYPARKHAEIPVLEGAKALGSYQKDFFAGTAALTQAAYGKGQAYYVAFQPEQSFLDAFFTDVLQAAGIQGIRAVRGDGHIRVSCREGDGERYYFVFNTSETETQSVILEEPMTDLLTGAKVTAKTSLPPLGVAVFQA
ncbi:MAG: beta-galactosidase [Clostridia bacterium]|nr:beta-galactosidase [Clostridia bacterium]